LKTILLTGAAGFIGSWTAEALSKENFNIIGVDNFNSYYDVSLKKTRAANLQKICSIHNVDIADYKQLEKIFDQYKIDQVCHLAAQAGVRYSIENPFAYENANNLGMLNILELCRHKKIPSLIYASSSSVYGGNKKIPFAETDSVDQPVSLYAATKKYNELAAHTYHHLYGLNTTGLRFFTVYGPFGRPDMAYFKFTKALLEGQPIDVYNHGKMKRDFTYITDIVAGVISALKKNYPYEVFNLGNSQSIELSRFIEVLEKEIGQKAKKNYLPMQPGDVHETFADISKSKKMLGFDPKIKIEQGLKKFVTWYKLFYKK